VAVVDRNQELVFLLFRPDGTMAAPPTLDLTDIKAKAITFGGIIVALQVAVAFDGRVPGSSPYVPRPDRPPVQFRADLEAP
jgi:hypothetical protein